MRELSLFTGIGGGLLGTKSLGFQLCGCVEINDYCQKILKRRMKDGWIEKAPIFGDIRAFISDGYANVYKNLVDIITAGFPCQPFSNSGLQLAERDGRNMWPETKKCISIIRPDFALLENVPGLLTNKYIQCIFGDLAEMGYDAKWGIISSANTGASHLRERLWILAHTNGSRLQWIVQRYKKTRELFYKKTSNEINISITAEGVCGLRNCKNIRRGNELSYRVDRLRAIGNGQDPKSLMLAWQILAN